MGFNYVVLGAGKQGTAAAYDLALFGQAERIVLADMTEAAARTGVKRLRELLGPELRSKRIILQPVRVDARRRSSLLGVLKGSQAVMSALPYYLNPAAAEASVASRAHYCDLGGVLDATRQILKLDAKARKAGVALIPDCGLAPGMCNTLAVCAMESLSITREIRIYCGGLPQRPRPPLGYKLVYSFEGVLGCYFGKAYALRDGAITQLEPFSDREELDFGKSIGNLEAFVTGGGTSTCPWTFEERVQVYEYKTLRYPGHFEKIQFLRGLGLLDEKPVNVDGTPVSPRKLFSAVVGPKLDFPEDRDLVVLRVTARGQKDGKPTGIAYDLMDRHDPKTGFSAMERTTGFSAAVVLEMLARGQIRSRGVVPLETAVPGRAFLDEIRKRGLRVTETIRVLDSGAASHSKNGDPT